MKQNRHTRLAARVATAGGVAAATSIANAVGYALTVVAARILEPTEFGAFGAVLALIIAGSVPALAVQATVAQFEARSRHVASAVRSGLVLALATGLGMALLSPALSDFLQLPTVAPVLSAAVGVAAMTATAPAIGLVQGAERFTALGVLIAGQAALRVGGGLIGMAVRPTASGALVGVAAGLTVGTVGAWLIARPPLGPGTRAAFAASSRATLVAGTLLLGLVLMTNADVVLARHVLSARESGFYVAGSVFTKIAFWLPQFVPLVAFPALTDPKRRRGAFRLGLLAVAGCGAALVLGTAVLAGPAVSVVAGSRYAELAPWIPAFTALGALFAVAQLLVYAHLASGDLPTTAVVWGVLLAYVTVVELTATGLGGVLIPALSAAGLLILWGVSRERVTSRRRDRQRDGAATPAAGST
ncbi:MAG TPA: oligosaccharide flippase family protein [Jiangellaceae bacterium]|nr:oligosaccharide flippase family protein [Jiangellaceae bacterium]